MVVPSSIFYTVSTVLFHKYGVANVAVKFSMSHFSMFVPTKATVKLADENMGHSQGIVLFYVIFLPVLLYIRWDRFIIFKVTLPTQYNQFP